MQEKFLKNIVLQISGVDSEGIVDLLHGKENVNEFLIAKKLKMTINQARNILYKLAEEGLVSFVRKKDKKNGGWYTYFWTLDVEKALHVLASRISAEIEQLKKQVASKQAKQFYYCPNCDIEMSEENALLQDFTCSECGEVFQAKDNAGYIEQVEAHLEKLRKNLVDVNAELDVLKKKHEASKERKRKREDKRKKEEREERRKKRQREKAREAKKTKSKKVKTKKKPVRKKVKAKGKATKKSPKKKTKATRNVRAKKKVIKKSPKKKTSRVKKKPIAKKTKKSIKKGKTRRKKPTSRRR